MKEVLLSLLVLAAVFHPSPAAADTVCPFKGQIDFTLKKFDLTLDLGDQSSVAFQVSEAGQDSFHFAAIIKHFRASTFDLSTELESSVGMVPGKNANGPGLQGKITSRYSLFNYKPIEELSGYFEMRNRTLYLASMTVGGVTLNGNVELFSPYKVDMAFSLADITMDDFLKFWGADADLPSEGLVSGQIFVSGIPSELGLKGNLATYSGSVQKLYYDSIVINAEGIYPIIYLSNSSVAQTDGLSFNLEGSLDLSKRGHLKEEIVALKRTPMVNKDGEYFEWTIKRKEGEGDSNATEFKYMRPKESSDNATSNSKEEFGILGVEQSIKF